MLYRVTTETAIALISRRNLAQSHRSVGDRTVGLLNPVIVDESERLLAGARRLAACKRRERPLRGQR
jgi:hypothetical protein